MIEITIYNPTNQLTFNREVNSIGKPVLEFEKWEIRRLGHTGCIAGPSRWIPIQIEAAEDVADIIAYTPDCAITYSQDDQRILLEDTYISADGSKLYYKHARFEALT